MKAAAHTGSLAAWAPEANSSARLSLLTLSTGESTERASSPGEGVTICPLSPCPPHPYAVCMYKCSFLTYTKSSFFYSDFYSCTECFHKGSHLAGLPQPPRAAERALQRKCLLYAGSLLRPGASSSTRHVTVPSCLHSTIWALLPDRNCLEGEPSPGPSAHLGSSPL